MNLNEFKQTEELIRPYVKPSPLIYSDWLSNLLSAEVYLKLECLQPANSFKIRGASNALLSNKRPEKVITASGGNHGLAVAYACRQQNIPCLVVLPDYTSRYRTELLERFGAEVKLYGAAWDEANEYALKLVNNDTLYIHPFADKEVILGQGTIALELEEDNFDALFCSVGGGGLLTGIALAFEAMRQNIDLYAVETIGAESLYQSINAGEIVELKEISSIAKTLGAKKTVPFIFDSLSRLLKKSMAVDDSEAVHYLFEFLENEKILIEPASSCTIAAAMKLKEELTGKKIVFIICGSNVSLAEIDQWKIDFNHK